MNNSYKQNNPVSLSALLLVVALLTGCATTETIDGEVNPDPYEETNRSFYRFNDALDRHVMTPIAKNYVKAVPEPARDGITNFFDNLEYLNVILHSFLQGKLLQGISDVTRFVVNSSVGIGGLFDVATPMGLDKHDEDFGQTLAAWGAEPGAYLYLPFLGPYTARNSPDVAGSYFSNPLTYISTIYLFPVTFLNLVNDRANLLEASEFVEEASIDPYSFTREAYLQRRKYLIHDGNPPADEYDEMFELDFEEESEPKLVIE
ncbi:MAG: VacJ family lipoprotein [Gammaproteobacteria bacterium]|nr:VacJ family lipoprotein [Gammaproteobacteria bacterium]MCY4211291.1 VacJ family lipoprotein [Gammaproteobacteria bacterium]MCY4283499.1 VacJ family lipoprotein [Gammaproteobacteria bacterium]MCY4338210.1 VacJ family lipoprotein [Gammaproteobacteria bacterium]